MDSNNAPSQRPSPDSGNRPHDLSSGLITRRGLVGFGGVAGGVVAGAAAWTAGPWLAILIGLFAALGSAAALHELLPRHW